MGEEFCSQAHAREYFGVGAARALEQQSLPEASPAAREKHAIAAEVQLDPGLSRTGRHRVMRLLNLAPVETPAAPPEVSAPAAIAAAPPEAPVVEPLPPPPPPAPVEPPFFSKICRVRFPRRGCAPTAAPILHEHFAAMSPVASTEEENTATAQLFALDQALSPDTPLELAPPPVHPPQCLPLTMPAIAAVQGARNALWEDTSWFWFAGEALELPVSGPEIATPEPSRNRTRRLFRTPGKEKLRSFNLSTYRHVYKESLEPWIIPPRPALPRWIGEPVKFDWARLVARLADFEPKLPAVPPLGSAKDPELPTNPSMMVGSTTAGHTGMRRAQSALPYLGRVVQFWQAQSWFTRSLALAIPVLAFVALKPSFDGSLAEPVVLAKEMPAAQSTVIRRNPTRERKIVESKLPAATAVPAVAPAGAAGLPEAKVEPKLNQVDRMLLARAAVELADDFSFGLDSWDSRNGTAWTYDQTGFIRPRSLALYRPSMNLTDYSVQFLGKIDYAAIGWVVRAVDFNNYHAVKLVQRGGGPLPRYTIVRYSVVDGKEGPRIEHPLPLNLYKDTLFRIRMDIRGSDYAILVQDSVVDSWSDDRFPFGGVGFFSGRGEESRVRWVQVTYQNDLIGKICAWFAPRV